MVHARAGARQGKHRQWFNPAQGRARPTWQIPVIQARTRHFQHSQVDDLSASSASRQTPQWQCCGHQTPAITPLLLHIRQSDWDHQIASIAQAAGAVTRASASISLNRVSAPTVPGTMQLAHASPMQGVLRSRPNGAVCTGRRVGGGCPVRLPLQQPNPFDSAPQPLSQVSGSTY